MRHHLIGKRFGKLTISKLLPYGKCLCDCICGVTGIEKRSRSVVDGSISSCGCARRDVKNSWTTTHGESLASGNTLEYRSWSRIIQRCTNPKTRNWEDYGGRGISIHPSWRKYEIFLRDVGRSPSLDHQIERINNNGNYEPGNVRWATRKEQCRNRRSSHYVTAFGLTRTIAEWSEVTGIKPGTIRFRICKGWEPEAALSPRQGVVNAA